MRRSIFAAAAMMFCSNALFLVGCADPQADISVETQDDVSPSLETPPVTVVTFSNWEGKSIDWGLPPDKKLFAGNSFLNKKAPDLVVEKWIGTEPKLEGKFVLVDFWATWCPPCKEAIPELNAYAKEFSNDLVVIGLSDEPEAKVRAMTTPIVEYFSAIDTGGRSKEAIGVEGIPHVLLIDPSGTVCWQGFPLDDGNALTAAVIEDCLARYQAE
jgi:thiol-disulfide isomerase/thioredoxin